MTEKEKTKTCKINSWYRIIVFSFFFMLPVLVVGIYFFSLKNKIHPNISILNTQVGYLDKKSAIDKLSSELKSPEIVILKYKDETFEMPLSTIDFSYDIDGSVEKAYSTNRNKSYNKNIIDSLKSVFVKNNITIVVKYNDEKLIKNLLVYSDQLAESPINPTLSVVNNEIEFTQGVDGSNLNVELIRDKIIKNLQEAKNDPVELEFEIIDPKLSEAEKDLLLTRANRIKDKKLSLVFEHHNFDYEKNDLLKLLDGKNGYNNNQIYYIYSIVKEKITRPPQNPLFEFLPEESGSNERVREFLPAKSGIDVDETIFSEFMVSLLTKLESTNDVEVNANIPVKSTQPDIRTEEINNLGIKELIGRGSSKYVGSILSRIHNIGVASSMFNGVLIEPGKTISFVDIVGDISVLTGYKQAYIIQDGHTVLGDGGGVCQVSTTLFRAALDAGLPIIERRPHSYRVTYYEQDSPPGLDATIYSPITDLKILNDTPGHILIQTYYDPKAATLDFEIYGTDDGRISTISKSVVTGQIPPPEPLYTDDPNLPTGVTKQVDWAAWGARVYFDYKVERGGELLTEKRFHSNYQPWQAKYLVGTGPAN